MRIRLLSTFSEVRDILECGVLALENNEYGENGESRDCKMEASCLRHALRILGKVCTGFDEAILRLPPDNGLEVAGGK